MTTHVLDLVKFSATSMLKAYEKVDMPAGWLSNILKFGSFPVSTRFVDIPVNQLNIGMIAAAEWGAMGRQTSGSPDLKVHRLGLLYTPCTDTLGSESIQDLADINNPRALLNIRRAINNKLRIMKLQHTATDEFMKWGAVHGKIVSADGTEVTNLFTEFGVTEKVISLDVANANADLGVKLEEINAYVEETLMGETTSGLVLPLGGTIFDQFIAHASFKDAFADDLGKAMIRKDLSKGFTWKDIKVVRMNEQAAYRNPVNGNTTLNRFVPLTEGRIIPLGTANAFTYHPGPADSISGANTAGRGGFNISTARGDHDKYVEIHTHSSQLYLNRRPDLSVKVTQ